MKVVWKLFTILSLVLVFLAGVKTGAIADEVVKVGQITCTGASLRSEPRKSASKYATLTNGTLVPITGEIGDFYIVDLASLENLKEPMEGVGYVLKDYVVTDTFRVTLRKATQIYSNPWGVGVAVAEKVKGASYLVLEEDNYWLCVQLKKGTAGVGFIKKSDLGYPTYNYYYQGVWYGSECATVLSESMGVRVGPNVADVIIGFLEKDTVVKKYGQPTNGYQPIEYDYNGRIIVAYVPEIYLIDVYGVSN